MSTRVFADAGEPGISFILPSIDPSQGGLARDADLGHFGTIIGKGGSGKSILALQLVTGLLDAADKGDKPTSTGSHAAFYFSLEASPAELRSQVEQFTWGAKRYAKDWEPTGQNPRSSGDNEYSNGLYIISVPSPADSLNALNLKIRQTIASELKSIRSLQAIIIDSMGAVDAGKDLRTDLIKLKELAETHRTFVLLLTEKYAFERHTSIEHYSQSIIHLEHDPGQQQHRRLYVQKARGQGFRSGYHYFELQQPPGERPGSKAPHDRLSRGIRVFPSIAAQSAYAHERLALLDTKANKTRFAPFFPDEGTNPFLSGEQIEIGSAVFLMGPPGTFKEHVASQFAQTAAANNGATIYVSFKADFEAIRSAMRLDGVAEAQDIGLKHDRPETLDNTVYFFDARSPLLTPEEILFKVRTYITPMATEEGDVKFERAVIWGLRRLYDFPNFGEGRVTQFLEALVTMLKSEEITTLLVDWPDQKVANTVPIVDLCQYILLTRVCYTPGSPDVMSKDAPALRKPLIDALWKNEPKQVALLRAQRTKRSVHHDQGAIFMQLQTPNLPIDRRGVGSLGGTSATPRSFDELWLNAGVKWEEDLSLLS